MDRPTRTYQMSTRAERTAETGRRIVSAAQRRFLANHYENVSLDAIASEAGVTRQTVLNRFGSKEALFAEAARAMQTPRHSLTGPEDRDRLVTSLVEEYEQLGDALIRLLAVEDRIPAVAELLGANRTAHRALLSSLFGDVLPGRSGARELVLGELHVAVDVYTWKLLRRDLGFSAEQTAAVMQRLVMAAVENGDRTELEDR